MEQRLPQVCPHCGAETVPLQRFCSRCGLPTAQLQAGSPNVLPEQPHPIEIFFPIAQQYVREDTTAKSPPRPISTREQYTSPHLFALAHSLRRKRIGIILAVVLSLLILLSVGYVIAIQLGIPVPGFGPKVQPPISSLSLNNTVPYAGLQVTLLRAQQAQTFIDDPHASQNGMVRVQLRAQNTLDIPVNILYTTSASLLLPGGKVVTPIYVKGGVGVAPGATQNSVVDFSVPSTVKLSQLILRLGTVNEAQMDIPFVPSSNLSAYAPKTTALNGQLQYLGLDWTLVNAISQFSIAGQQASKGMRYVIMTLSVNNTLTQTAIAGSAFDYVRLKAADETLSPVSTTLPVAFDAGAQAKTGTVTFLVPQHVTTLTLILASQSNSGFDQATAIVRLPG